jgi:hypothetical protein
MVPSFCFDSATLKALAASTSDVSQVLALVSRETGTTLLAGAATFACTWSTVAIADAQKNVFEK